MASALHVAAELGAKNIFVIGHDLRGGNYSGYPLARGPKYSRFRKQSVLIKKFLVGIIFFNALFFLNSCQSDWDKCVEIVEENKKDCERGLSSCTSYIRK